MLINPTGRPKAFRPTDWCMELNVLYTKVVFGGEGSNHTLAQIIKESPLIQIFRDIHLLFEKHLFLNHLTKRHGEPDMTLTYDEVLKHLAEEKAHIFVPGRRSAYSIPDWDSVGLNLLMSSSTAGETSSTADAVPALEDTVSIEDLTVEIDGF